MAPHRRGISPFETCIERKVLRQKQPSRIEAKSLVWRSNRVTFMAACRPEHSVVQWSTATLTDTRPSSTIPVWMADHGISTFIISCETPSQCFERLTWAGRHRRVRRELAPSRKRLQKTARSIPLLEDLPFIRASEALVALSHCWRGDGLHTGL
jgi:hypothetical protein